MVDIPKYVKSRRASYNKLPAVVRGVIVSISFVIGTVGLVLVFTPPPFFDLGVIALLFALSILSFQFDWAHQSLTYVTKKLADKTFRRKLLAIVGTTFLVVIVGIVYWLAHKH